MLAGGINRITTLTALKELKLDLMREKIQICIKKC
jgi:hypothetical protein